MIICIYLSSMIVYKQRNCYATVCTMVLETRDIRVGQFRFVRTRAVAVFVYV